MKSARARRVYKDSPEAAGLITSLVSLYLKTGSLNKLSATLSNALSNESIRPNRLKPLLGFDSKRSINFITFEQIQSAVNLVNVDEDCEEQTRKKIVSSFRDADFFDKEDDEAFRQLAEQIGTPFEVIKRVLSSQRGDAVAKPSGLERKDRRSRAPDWTFQDDAFNVCLQKIQSNKGKKWGVVIPTGGGKTRVAVRIVLEILNRSSDTDSKVIWVTHRTSLKDQAKKELRRALLEQEEGDPEKAMHLFLNRVIFQTADKNKLESLIQGEQGAIELVVVDEAHHAAAASYEPVVKDDFISGLWLTATPNRLDQKAIGIEGIAYEITYSELFKRGVIIKPVFETEDAPCVQWNEEGDILQLAEYLLDRSTKDFIKTLVLVTRRDYACQLYEKLREAIALRPKHPINEDEIGYVHGSGSSTNEDSQAFINRMSKEDRGILISTQSFLGEGFDDPLINSVVITYPSESMVLLMQAAGRALRWSEQKKQAFVVQVRKSSIQYHYNEEWLYQDISDSLRPRVHRLHYSDTATCEHEVEEFLNRFQIEMATKERVITQASKVDAGEKFSIMLFGSLYDGKPETFESEAKWRALAFGEKEVRIFNNYCCLAGHVNNRNDWLKTQGIYDGSPDHTTWLDLLYSCGRARKELEVNERDGGSRNYRETHGTTWLNYATFDFETGTHRELEEFFADSHNKLELLATFFAAQNDYQLAVKIPHPINGTLGYLLNQYQTEEFKRIKIDLTQKLRECLPKDSFYELEKWKMSLEKLGLPYLLLQRFESFLGHGEDLRVLVLSSDKK